MLISVQGNDVVSGLKWMLLSFKSVMLMAPPIKTTFVMEHLAAGTTIRSLCATMTRP